MTMSSTKFAFSRDSIGIRKAPKSIWNWMITQKSVGEKWFQGLPHTEGGGANMGLFCPKNGPIFHLAESTTIFQMVHTRHTHIPPPSPGPSCRRNVPKILLKNLLWRSYLSFRQAGPSFIGEAQYAHLASNFAPLWLPRSPLWSPTGTKAPLACNQQSFLPRACSSSCLRAQAVMCGELCCYEPRLLCWYVLFDKYYAFKPRHLCRKLLSEEVTWAENI